MEDKELNEKESLELISKMIRNTQNKVVHGAGMPFIISGYTTVFVAILVWYLTTTTNNSFYHWFWFLIPVIIYLAEKLSAKKDTIYVKTYIDRIIGQVWLVVGVSVCAVALLAMFYRIPILFMVILLIGIGATITGFIIKVKPVVTLGFVGIAMAFPCVIFPLMNNPLYFSLVFVVMTVIPGHILNYMSRRHV